MELKEGKDFVLHQNLYRCMFSEVMSG